MKLTFRQICRKLSTILGLFVFFYGLTVQAQKPGAHLWGDGDSNGIIEVSDLSVLTGILGNPGQLDSEVYTGYPQSRFRQELDGNGLIEIPDLSILMGWVGGNFDYNPGQADVILLEGETYYLGIGDSVMLSVIALSDDAMGRAIRTGFGVIFRISPSSTCTTAQFYGYDVNGGDTINLWRNEKAYHYTTDPNGPDHGKANMKLNGNGCEDGQEIIIEVYIPDDVEANVTPGRFKAKLKADKEFKCHLDLIPPETTLDSTPPILTNSNNADFSFSCNETPCTFECNLDSQGWAACPSPKSYTGLLDGAHSFQVRAKDKARNLDPTPATHNWIIDTNPPSTTITFGPANPTKSTSASFQFSCFGGPCTFECKLDSGIWESCSSPKNYSSLIEGFRSFTVRATDQAGNVEPVPPVYNWEIDLTPPATLIDSYPADPSSSNSASFTFHCMGGPCAFECNLDSAGWQACASPKDYTGLSEGAHSFQVRATDQAGNTDPSPPNYNWGIQIPPETTITSGPTDPTQDHFASFEFECNETGCLFECKMDSGAWEPCTSPKNYGDEEPWQTTSTIGAPSPRYNFTPYAIWTGTEMIIWGGNDGGSGSYGLATGGRYNPISDSWTPTSIPAISARMDHSVIWTGTLMIVWGGYSSLSFLNTGGRYNPATDSWTTTTITDAPTARFGHTAVWTGTEMIIWGGEGSPEKYLNTGGKYDPINNSWTATSLTNVPAGRNEQTAVWTGTEMIVFGGRFAGGVMTNTGGKYNPSSNSWVSTSITNAPSARWRHTMIWTGTEVIVWGGMPGGWCDTGGKYNPLLDSWTSTNTTNVPEARGIHTAVWTGTEMIVWGGGDGALNFNTGGRYNPFSDSWRATSITNVPTARYLHIAVWTGSKMIIWGGTSGPTGLNTGGRYDPSYDLSEGSHTFEVRAIDSIGNVDPSPATYSWTISD